MKDPTRILDVLAVLQRAWEGQPDLELATLWGIIQNHGIGWGSSDGELVAVLNELAERHPARVTDLGDRLLVADTSDPVRKITVDPVLGRVTVRGVDVRPASWRYRDIVRLEVGMPVVITDEAGIDHRLGVPERMTAHPYQPGGGLSGMARREVGDRVVGVLLDDASLALIGHGIDVYVPGRREITHTRYRYERLLRVAIGSPLSFAPGAGAPEVELATIERLFPVDL